jgi:hypothetical protein
VAIRKRKNMSFGDRVLERLGRRIWPIGISVLFILLGSLYIFQWGSVVEHIPKLWLSPQDFWITYFNSSQLVHGHFGAIYQANVKFVEFPGMLVALAPLGALSGAFHTSTFEITKYGVVPAPGFVVHVRGLNVPFLNAQSIRDGKNLYVLQPQWTIPADLYALLLSCTALFACDALAERLRVPNNRRTVLCVAEAVLLWNVTVLWGHPEDAVAVALAVYALIFALDRRFVAAGWLFGAALAFQPLVLLMLPVLLAIAWRRYVVGMIIRTVLPTAVLIAAPLASNFSATVHSLVDQPSPPGVNHVTPWTALSPNLGGGLVAAGPIRLLGLLIAIALGFWVYRHWLERPELLAWSCAAALALRSYTESVMTPYYAWAALAVGVAVAARCSARRFGIAIGLAVATTVMAQWMIAWFPWWAIQVAGLTALLAVTYAPASLQVARVTSAPARKRVLVGAQQNRESGTDKQRSGRGAVTKPSGSKTANTRAPAQAQSSSAAIRAMQKAAKSEKAKSKTVADTRKSPNTKTTPQQKGPPTQN